MDWDTPAGKLAFIGPVYARRLEKLDIRTLSDLLYHAPTRYEDYSQVKTIRQLKPDEPVTVIGTITQSKNLYTKSRKQIQVVSLKDDSGNMQVMWFNQPFISKLLTPGKKTALSGIIV